jgi:medium-chain acyl-[acyl-carrier-protein] hydrolase
MEELVASLVRALEPSLQLPFSLLGHCSGAWVMFELARALTRRGLPPPARLIAIDQAGPEAKTGSRRAANQDALQRLRELDGTDSAILDHSAMLELLRPMIESDFRLIDNYVYKAGVTLGIPITVIGARENKGMPEAGLRSWQHETTHELELTLLQADHFFRGRSWEELARLVGSLGRRDMPDASPGNS